MEPEERIDIIEASEENGKKKSSRYRVLATVLCCIVAFILGAVLTMYISGTTVKELELKSLIKHTYDGTVNPATAEDYEMMGIVSGLKDKNSLYFTADEMVSMNEAVSGKFGGIGVQMLNENEKYVIVEVFENAPAAKQGILAGDVLLSVNGVSVSEIPFDEITDHVRGEIGTEVLLGLERDGKSFEVTVVREQIMVTSVQAKMLDDNIGYVNITSFDEDTDEELDKAISGLEGAKALVLDLRNNPGGFLYVCADAVDLFLEKEQTIVKACYKTRENVMKTKTDAKFTMPMAVLINGGSASSSEIFASCMQDNGRATIVGTKSYGKGSIQRTYEFYDGSGANLTVGHFYSPSGKKIDGVGVTPDKVVELSETEDNQLKTAVALLKAE